MKKVGGRKDENIRLCQMNRDGGYASALLMVPAKRRLEYKMKRVSRTNPNSKGHRGGKEKSDLGTGKRKS